jgi:hypothetical protein
MNAAIIPILLIIIFRGFNIFKNRNHAKESFVQR